MKLMNYYYYTWHSGEVKSDMQRSFVLNLCPLELSTKEIIYTILQFCFIIVLPQNTYGGLKVLCCLNI